MMVLNKIFNYLKSFFKFNYRNNRISHKDGQIFIMTIFPISSDIDLVVDQCIDGLASIIIDNNDFFFLESKKYDEYELNIMFLISFDSKDGYRVVETNLMSYISRFDEINYNVIRNNLKEGIILIIEKYNIETINNLLIKVV